MEDTQKTTHSKSIYLYSFRYTELFFLGAPNCSVEAVLSDPVQRTTGQ